MILEGRSIDGDFPGFVIVPQKLGLKVDGK
jgi:hypothetical protein